MCAISMIGDHYTQRWGEGHYLRQYLQQQDGAGGAGSSLMQQQPPVTRMEFEALKKEVLEMKDLLIRAKEYDEKNNQPHCEQEEKIALLKKVAEAVGVSLDEVFGVKK